jgi:hypothetical protein
MEKGKRGTGFIPSCPGAAGDADMPAMVGRRWCSWRPSSGRGRGHGVEAKALTVAAGGASRRCCASLDRLGLTVSVGWRRRRTS